MPDPLSPSDLAMLDALGEATPEQLAALRAACERDAQLAAEHRRLVSEMRLMDAALTPAPSAPETIPAMPEHIRQILDAERRATLAELRGGNTGSPANVVQMPPSAAERAALEKTGAAARAPASGARKWLRRLAIAAAVLVFAGLASQWFWRPAAPPAALVLSPSAETGLTGPALVWENAPGQRYNVWVLPAKGPVETVDPLFKAENVISPISFADLKAESPATALAEGEDYRLLVCRIGTQRLGGVAGPFHVAPNATSAFPKPLDAPSALQAMHSLAEEGKPGDALGLFATLPPEMKGDAEIAALEQRLREQVRSSRQVR